MATIEYEGTDITSLVSTTRCVYEAREEGRVPQLSIEFDDERGLWDSWQPKPGDRVMVSARGAAATGAMFVKSCTPIAGGYELRADALPIADVSAVRIWKSTTLRFVVEQLAAVLGLSASFHGCDDMSFTYVRQDGEGALPVLARICTLAGCTFDVYDSSIHVCSRAWVESQAIAGTLAITSDSAYKYKRRAGYTSCSLNQTEIAGVRAGIVATYGTSGRNLAKELDKRVGVPGTSELERACAGILACANARLSGGHSDGNTLSPFTPGALCVISCAKAPSLSGRAVITRVRNDFVNNRSKVWWR